jgi:AcrR family transcriptional regulator
MIRNTNVKPRRRTYESELRDEQAEATRTRILEGLVRTMSEGVAGISVPAVAREAGVSIPTVYRHFGSKKGLIEALGPFVAGRAGLVPARMPATLAEFEPMARDLFRNLASMDRTLRAAVATELGSEARRAAMPDRLAMIRRVIDRLAPVASEADRERLTRLALILLSSAAFHAYVDYLELGPDEAAELVTWAIATLLAGVGAGAGAGVGRRPRAE